MDVSEEKGASSAGVVETRRLKLDLPPGGLALKNGGVLPEVEVAYETYGELSAAGDNTVLICHALTGDAHVAGYHSPGEKPGWWEEMVGPGKGIDTDYYHVICSNILGGCAGTTGPSSINPVTGRPYGASFPAIAIADMVEVQRLLLAKLGIGRLAAVVGGSLGGMQALEWAIAHPEIVDRCICIASGVSLSTQALAFDAVAREAIMNDPAWLDGDYHGTGKGPAWGLAHARKIGHITYLSPEIMKRKFGRERTAPDALVPGNQKFQVESYLDHQGRKLVERFDANSYLRITEAIDNYDVAAEHGSIDRGFSGVRSKFLVVALSSDWLFPPEQSEEIALALVRNGKQVSYCVLSAPHGHDAFLVEIEHLADTIRAFLPWVTPVRGRRRDAGAAACDSGDADGVNALISRYIPSGAKVLDLGCGSGDLLSALARDRQASGFGVDRDLDSVIRTMDRGHSVFQADLDRGLSMLPAGSYDCAVLSGTLQQVRRPRMVILEMLRVAREGIVVFPNFAHWKNRVGLALRGRMPKSQVLPYEWHETPNIHLATLTDVLLLCEREGICVLDTVCIHGCLLDRFLIAIGLRNLGARRVLLRLAGRARPCAAEAET